MDREHGITGLSEELNYLVQCLISFKWLPATGRYESLSDEELSKYYLQMNEKYSNVLTYEPLPISPSTIKKRRPKGGEWGGTANHAIPPYRHIVYRGLPLGDLLEYHPITGREALFNLFSYFIISAFGELQRELTRETFVEFSMNMMPLHSKPPLKRKLAEEQIRLLTYYKVVRLAERTTMRDGLLYLVLPQRYRGRIHWDDLTNNTNK